MRRLIIDTDTASDDAVAIIMALREKAVSVEAITVVAGNVPLDQGVKNALVSIEVANTYQPPVYAGMGAPLIRDLFLAEDVHGSDGLGEMNLETPQIEVEEEHAVDALIRLVAEYGNEIELVTLGPLTNIAMACLKAPEIMKTIKKVTIMGGSGLESGNVTFLAEFNIYVDAEAAQIVLRSGMPLLFVGWDVSLGSAFLDQVDIDRLRNSGSSIAEFCVRCNQTLIDYNVARMGIAGLDLPDPVTMAAMLYPEIVKEEYRAFAYVEHKSEASYGHLAIDYMDIEQKEPIASFCKRIDGDLFKEKLYQLVA
ncbi:MAG: nucleoside hydrolase [Anaerolineaceae bacterium]|nr:nucleoside hydrolase [Anaerolineaceae bacterium]